jgi:transcriptional regulator with XRE-family HTH domain
LFGAGHELSARSAASSSLLSAIRRLRSADQNHESKKGRSVRTVKTVVVKKVPNSTDKYVGALVRIRRTTLGKSQSWLGDAVGLTFQQIQKYEKGTNRIGSSRLQQFANLLGAPISYFFEGAPNASSQRNAKAIDPPTAYLSKFISSSDGLALIKAFMQIKDVKLRRGIAKLVKQIADRHED